MAQNVVINGVTYTAVPKVEVPLSGSSGTAEFVDTSDATLDSGGKMLSGVTAYADGTKYTGTIETKTTASIGVSGPDVTVPAGYYASGAVKTIASGTATAPETIAGTSAGASAGNNTMTLTKTLSVTPVVSAGYISAGTASNVSISLTAPITTRGERTYTPGTSDQTLGPSIFLTGVQTIKGDANLVGSNIKSGVSIFGVAGSLTSAMVSQDSTTKVLTIS